MRLKAILICVIFSLTVLPITPANAQVTPAVNLECESLDPSGAVEIEVYPGADLIGIAYCTVSNPNSYQEKIDIQVTADGLVTAHPGTITLGPNAEEEFTVTVKADERMTMSGRNLRVTATVTEVNGAPPPNIAESEVSMIVSILQFSGLQVEAVEASLTLESEFEQDVEFKVYNQGNWADQFSVGLTKDSLQELEYAGFSISIPLVKIEIESMAAPAKALIVLKTPKVSEDWPINSDGQHEKTFTLEFIATSEFSCRSEGYCNSETAYTTITVYAEVSSPEESDSKSGVISNSMDNKALVYGGGGAGVILLLILFVVMRRKK
jgi:hypothetical protein